MPAVRKHDRLPRRFEDLVRGMPPRHIADDVQHQNNLDMIDRLMSAGRLTRDQEDYLETLVQLVRAYEAAHHAIDARARPLDTLKHLVAENGMTASDLARLLDVHPSMGSKILKGERSLTVDHIKTLSARFHLRPEAFID